jgi:ATP/ADP translocase
VGARSIPVWLILAWATSPTRDSEPSAGMQSIICSLIAAPYLTVLLGLLVAYGLHRSHLVWMLWKHRVASSRRGAARDIPDGRAPAT